MRLNNKDKLKIINSAKAEKLPIEECYEGYALGCIFPDENGEWSITGTFDMGFVFDTYQDLKDMGTEINVKKIYVKDLLDKNVMDFFVKYKFLDNNNFITVDISNGNDVIKTKGLDNAIKELIGISTNYIGKCVCYEKLAEANVYKERLDFIKDGRKIFGDNEFYDDQDYSKLFGDDNKSETLNKIELWHQHRINELNSNLTEKASNKKYGVLLEETKETPMFPKARVVEFNPLTTEQSCDLIKNYIKCGFYDCVERKVDNKIYDIWIDDNGIGNNKKPLMIDPYSLYDKKNYRWPEVIHGNCLFLKSKEGNAIGMDEIEANNLACHFNSLQHIGKIERDDGKSFFVQFKYCKEDVKEITTKEFNDLSFISKENIDEQDIEL